MGNITRSARMHTCTVRLPCCNGDPSTTVFAHAPSNTKGFGIKSPDWWGAYCCSACHDALDGRSPHDYGDDLIFRRWMYAIHETQTLLFEKGLLIEK